MAGPGLSSSPGSRGSLLQVSVGAWKENSGDPLIPPSVLQPPQMLCSKPGHLTSVFPALQSCDSLCRSPCALPVTMADRQRVLPAPLPEAEHHRHAFPNSRRDGGVLSTARTVPDRGLSSLSLGNCGFLSPLAWLQAVV